MFQLVGSLGLFLIILSLWEVKLDQPLFSLGLLKTFVPTKHIVWKGQKCEKYCRSPCDQECKYIVQYKSAFVHLVSNWLALCFLNIKKKKKKKLSVTF